MARRKKITRKNMGLDDVCEIADNSSDEIKIVDIKASVMAANIDALKILLEKAVSDLEEAQTYIKDGNTVAAFGTFVSLEHYLDAASKMSDGTLHMYRMI